MSENHATLLKQLEASTASARPYTTWGEAESISAAALGRVFAHLEAYDPFGDPAEVAEHEALCAKHGWSKSRFGIYGVTPCRTITRVLEAVGARGAAPEGSDVVVLGSSVGWVALGLAFLLPNARRFIGLEILRRRCEVAREALSEGASPATWALPVYFAHADAREGDRAFEGAALVWDSLGFGGGVRAEILAAVARKAPPGCVLVTYDALPTEKECPELANFKALGEPLVLPNSWTPRQRYYVYELQPSEASAPVDPAVDAPAAPEVDDPASAAAPAPAPAPGGFFADDDEGPGAVLALVDDPPLRKMADSHQARKHPDAATADGAAPEADQGAFLGQLASKLGTDHVAAFLS